MRAKRTGRRPRPGVTIVYSIIMLVVLCMLVSLAVDYGRAQVVKTELQRAADLAARYGASGIPQGNAVAQSQAQAAAADNTADGTPVVLQSQDVEVGTWGGSPPAFTPGGTPANAVRVTARRTAARGNAVPLIFARVLGQSTCDVTAVAVATELSTPNYGIVGLSSMNMNTTGVWDSYDSSAGAYSALGAHSQATAASNGSITLNSSSVKGDARPGPGMNCTGGTVTGSRSPLANSLSYLSVNAGSFSSTNDNSQLPPAYFTGSDFGMSGATVTIAGGTYYLHDFIVSGNAIVNCTGPITIYVSGAFNLSGVTVNAYQMRPGNFRVLLLPGATLQLRNQTSLYADVYGPDTDMTFSSQSTLYGRVIGASLQQTGTGGIHQDESLTVSWPKITSVR